MEQQRQHLLKWGEDGSATTCRETWRGRIIEFTLVRVDLFSVALGGIRLVRHFWMTDYLKWKVLLQRAAGMVPWRCT